jgi:chemotaxis protein histidine kinase CheA
MSPERGQAFTKAALDDFVEETLEILSNLKGGSQRAAPGKNFLERVEIGLHTIKGNAAAFGFQDLASTASRLLDGLRLKTSTARGSFDLRGVSEFAERAEQYLDRVKDGDVPASGFFEARGGVRRASGSQIAAPVPEPNRSDVSWEKDIEEILASAPVVNPSLDGLTQIAADAPAKPLPQPEREEPKVQRAPVKQAAASPAAPALRGEASRDPTAAEAGLGTGAAGYAFEAALAYETVRTLALQYKSDPRLSSLAGDLAEFLRSFVKWGGEARGTPLVTYIKEALEWAEGFAGTAGRQLHHEVTGTNVTVLPGVGHLLRELVKEVFRALLPTSARNGGQAVAKAALHATPGYCTVRLSGLTNSQRTSARLQLYAIQERVEKIGVIVTQGERNEVLIDVPDNLNSLEVLVLEAGGSYIGIPWHRVVAVEETRKLEAALKGDGWLETAGEKIPIVDLTRDMTRGGGTGQDGSSIVVLRSEGRKQGARVNKVLERREMPVQVASHADWQSDVIGLCLSPSDFRCMPLLRWSLR